jgi:hypothetical protein
MTISVYEMGDCWEALRTEVAEFDQHFSIHLPPPSRARGTNAIMGDVKHSCDGSLFHTNDILRPLPNAPPRRLQEPYFDFDPLMCAHETSHAANEAIL